MFTSLISFLGSAFSVIEKLLDLWRRHEIKAEVRRKVLEDLDQKAEEQREKAETIEDTVRRLGPDAVPDGMSKYRIDD